jgi:hypothetical protein
MDNEQWIAAFSVQVAYRWPSMSAPSFHRLARDLAAEPCWRQLNPASGADAFVRSMEEMCWLDFTALALRIDVENAEEQDMAMGVAAAVAVFRQAHVSPAAAERAMSARESWDALDYPDGALPTATTFDAALVWEKAKCAARKACCGRWAVQPAHFALKLVWKLPEQVDHGQLEHNSVITGVRSRHP